MVIRLGQRSPTDQWRQRLIDADWATPNKTKPLSKRDLSPGTPDSEMASPEPKKVDFNASPEHKKHDFDSFASINDSYYNID